MSFLLKGDIRPRKRGVGRLELRNLLSANTQLRPQICVLFQRLVPDENKGRFGSMRETQRDEFRGLTQLTCVHVCMYTEKREIEAERNGERERERERGEHCLDSQSEVIQKCVSISSKSMPE